MLARLLPRCATATAQRSALRSAPLRCGSSSVRSLHSIGEVDGVHPSHSSGVLVGPGCKTVYLSSQPGVDAAGTVPAGAAEQAELAFGAVELLLADVGMTAKDGACALLRAPRLCHSLAASFWPPPLLPLPPRTGLTCCCWRATS